MLINVFSAKCVGIEAVPITVEVNITRGIGIHLVGLGDAAVKESLLRTTTALQSMGYNIPGKKIVINLAPADTHKKGSGFDLAIAIGILMASGQIVAEDVSRYVFMGELGLDGAIRQVPGAVPVAEMACKTGMKACIFPEVSAQEAAGCYDVDIIGVKDLSQAIAVLYDDSLRKSLNLKSRRYIHVNDTALKNNNYIPDFSELLGQEKAKRGMEIAAAGGHNIIMIGTPGSGKSSFAKALTGILPVMSKAESVVTNKIYSVSGLQSGKSSWYERPFRSPHYSASQASIIGGGGGENTLPGEISLAHNGVLFLDEFTRIPRNIIEALRSPLEDRKVSISRLRSKVEYPASFMLVAAANPCPCGYYGDGDKCSCSVSMRQNYMSKLSGPIMDRIDIQLWMPPVKAEFLVRLTNKITPESSELIKLRVVRARNLQSARFQGKDIFTNSEMSARHISDFCPLSEDCKKLLEKLIDNAGLSARAYARIIKLSRTIADLELAVDDSLWNENNEFIDFKNINSINVRHIIEASGYRFLDKQSISPFF